MNVWANAEQTVRGALRAVATGIAAAAGFVCVTTGTLAHTANRAHLAEPSLTVIVRTALLIVELTLIHFPCSTESR